MPTATLQDWANFSQIVGTAGVTGAAVALVLGYKQLPRTDEQLRKADVDLVSTQRATYGQMLMGVEQILSPYNDIRSAARDKDWHVRPNLTGPRAPSSTGGGSSSTCPP